MSVLVLAGTREGRILVTRMADQGIDAIASLAGATEDPAKIPLPTRIGGFGGCDGFRHFLLDQNITAVIDATHPFAARITATAVAVCADMKLRYLRLERLAWEAGRGDRWYPCNSAQKAETLIPQDSNVFLAVGHKGAQAFSLIGCTVYARSIQPIIPYPFEGEGIIARPPFLAEDEIAMFERLRIDWVVCKNSGGAEDGKLTAARVLGIPVAMLERPALPDCDVVHTVAEALAWLN